MYGYQTSAFLQDESLLIHKGWMVIKNANVYRIIGMLCFNALWQVHRFVSQVYGWIVYKINKLAPKWEKKSFPFVSVLDSFLSCLAGILEWISSTCLLCVPFFPPSNIKTSSPNSLSEGEDEEVHICLSQILENGFTTKWTSSSELPLLCLHLVLSLGALQVLVFKLAHVFLFLNTQRKKGWEERDGLACALHLRFCTLMPQNKCLSFVSFI